MTAFCRVATLLFPIMDNLRLESFWFFVPKRLVWTNWVRMMGEQDSPSDSISYQVPQVVIQDASLAPCSLADYMGLPMSEQVTTATLSVNALPFRAYNLIYGEWFRDENLQSFEGTPKGDGPDTYASYYGLRRRGKRHDYFTSCLPWPQKGPATPLPLGGEARIKGFGTIAGTPLASGSSYKESGVSTGAAGINATYAYAFDSSTAAPNKWFMNALQDGTPQVFADLSTATATTINALRQAFQIQRLIERDARGGTRYTELLRAHFGVVSPDARLQRPEYLGGGSSSVQISPIAQTAPTVDAGGITTKPLGALGAVGTSVAQHGFSHSFTEHGYILGLIHVRAELTYQQGLHKMWTRLTRYDFYWPAFANLGEQDVKQREIYCNGVQDASNDLKVFGYQERWAEYRHKPSRITGKFRSTSAGPGLDTWHLAQYFGTPPTLGSAFIADTTDDVLKRALAAGSVADGQQILLDAVFQERRVRAMPAYSVPGNIDRL